MNGVTYAKGQLEQSFNLLNVCSGGMDDAQYNHKPGGTANPPAKSHIHALTSTEFFLQMMGGPPMQWPAFAAANGLPANPMEIWGYSSDIPIAQIAEYSANVQKSVIDWVSSLKEDDLDREVETNFFGKKTVAWILQLGAAHVVGHGGDIAAVKGLQGLKGLPF